MKAAGGYRQQGKNYIVEDGDIIFFKVNLIVGDQNQNLSLSSMPALVSRLGRRKETKRSKGEAQHWCAGQSCDCRAV